MRIYVIKDNDFDVLLTALDRSPKHGPNGGSSQVLSPQEQEAHDEAHRFYNLQVRRWVDRMKLGTE